MRTVKATYQAPDDNQTVTCRFEADLNVASDYQRLVSKLTQIFPELAASNFTIHCPDSGGDTIVAATDDDIFIALGSIPPGGTLNIVIEEKARPSRVASSSAIGCDTCGVCIYGHRYKCTVCTDFYLCTTCEQYGRHSHHPVMRTTTNEPPRPSSQRTRLWDMGAHRHSPLFEDYGSRQRATRPFGSGFFHCLNPSAFEEFHQMAADLTRAWCGSMPPPKSNTHSSQPSGGTRQGQPTNNTRSRDTQQPDPGHHVYTKSEEFEEGLFTQMVDEMTEKMNSTMNNIGAKHKASNGQTAKDNGRPYHDSESNSPSDFEQMTEMLSPMMKNLIGAVGGECNTQQEVQKRSGLQDGQNEESVVTDKEVEQTGSHVNLDAEFVSHVASTMQSSPCVNDKMADAEVVPHVASTRQSRECTNNKDPDEELGLCVDSTRQSSPCANYKDPDAEVVPHVASTRQSNPCVNNKPPDAELGSCVASTRQSSPCANKEPPTAGRTDNLKSIPYTKDRVLPDPPQYATIQRGSSLYPKVDQTNSNTKNKEDSVKSPTSTGIPRFNSLNKQGSSSHTAHNGLSYPSVFNKTRSISQTTNSGQSRSNSITGICLPNLKTEVQSNSHTRRGQAGSYTTNEEQATPCGTSKEQSTPSSTSKGQSTPCSTSKEQSTPSSTSKGQSTPCSTNKEQATPCGTSKEQSTPCSTSKEQSTPCSTSKGQSTPCSTSKEQSTPSSTSKDKSIPCSTSKDQSTPSSTSKDQSTPSSTSKEQSTPSSTNKDKSIPCGTSKGQPTPCGTSKEQSTPSSTSKDQSTPSSTSKGQSARCGTSKDQSTPCSTSKEEPTPCGTSKGQSAPCSTSKGQSALCGTNKGQSSDCNSTGKQFTLHGSTQEGSSQCSESKELSSIQSCKTRQPSASNDKAQHKNTFITHKVQPKLSVFKATDQPQALDVSARNGVHGISNKQCGTTSTRNEEPVSDHVSDVTESNTTCTSYSMQPPSEDTNPGQVVTKPHTNPVEKEQCQEPVHTAKSKQSHTGATNTRQSNIPQPSARKSLPSTSNTSNMGYSSAGFTRKPYFDPRGGSAANKAFSRVRKPPLGDSKRGKTCQCGNPFDTKSIHRLTSPCSEPIPGTSSMPDIASTSGAKDKETEDEKLTNALDSLETMGFADIGGSLTELLKEEEYDVWRVLERVLTC